MKFLFKAEDRVVVSLTEEEYSIIANELATVDDYTRITSLMYSITRLRGAMEEDRRKTIENTPRD